MARASFSWIPVRERGLVTGINFSASRLGGAAAMFAMPLLIGAVGWRMMFYILGGVGFIWAVVWYAWFRNDPTEHTGISESEQDYILANRQQVAADAPALNAGQVVGSANMWLTMFQYFCSNFTFFFALTWLYPYVKTTYDLTAETAGILAAIPLLGGALGNYVSGYLVDALYRKDKFVLSRRLPAIIGFALATIGLLSSMHMSTATGAIVFLTIAVFGADMTLSPSWNFCVDIGGRSAGAVSGTMNMAGNIGSFLTSLAFPYLTAWFAASTLVGEGKLLTKDTDAFFYIAAILNAAAIVMWMRMNPRETLVEG
jgi:ACS family glucarate transporter-like MFS transporter